ncbi:TetR/AcrR family transcriptional regulator C-terminal ligand-binding domain-containing protein [Nonomuraea sp. NPDC052129]|uniref:TetR/AcrR family transcriptional regulator C-terminal ligand-binding domain-containing protein n=1 Tax=Nonomuraea sp. NPDC052129 TaxID=3154651 RepID=UPI0034183FC2
MEVVDAVVQHARGGAVLEVGGGILAAVEVGGPVVVGRAQQRLPGADSVTGGQRVPTDALDARRHRGPLGRPGLLVTLRDLPAGDQDLAEARYDDALAEGLYTGVTAPRRAAARAILQGAIDRGELPQGLDLDLGTDLLIAPHSAYWS